MEKVFSDLIQTSKPADVTTFCMDDRDRKFYLGNNIGNIKSFNASNGVFIKTIGTDEEGTTHHRGRKGHFEADYTREITSLIYANEDHLLITASFNSVINVYDESNPELPIRLRTIRGGHGYSEVRCLAYSAHLALMASGDSNGSVNVWDFEMSRLEGLCLFHTREIVALKFLEPFPVLVSSAADNYVCLWAVRGASAGTCYSCLCRLPNLLASEREVVCAAVGCVEAFVAEGRKLQGGKTPELSTEKLKECYKKFARENDVDDQVFGSSPRQKTSKNLAFIESEKLFEKNYREVKLRAMVSTGDEKGKIRVWDFTPVLAHYSIGSVESYREQKAYYNPRRSENVDAAVQLKLVKLKYSFLTVEPSRV